MTLFIFCIIAAYVWSSWKYGLMRMTVSFAAVFAALWLLGIMPSHADDAPKTEVTSTTKPNVQVPLPPAPPRGCVETATGDLVPIPRSEGDDVDMDACKPAKRKKLNIFQVNK